MWKQVVKYIVSVNSRLLMLRDIVSDLRTQLKADQHDRQAVEQQMNIR